jgi:hypothetical protein
VTEEFECDCPYCRQQYLKEDVQAQLARFEGRPATEECRQEIADVVEYVKATHEARWMREDGVPLQ